MWFYVILGSLFALYSLDLLLLVAVAAIARSHEALQLYRRYVRDNPASTGKSAVLVSCGCLGGPAKAPTVSHESAAPPVAGGRDKSEAEAAEAEDRPQHRSVLITAEHCCCPSEERNDDADDAAAECKVDLGRGVRSEDEILDSLALVQDPRSSTRGRWPSIFFSAND